MYKENMYAYLPNYYRGVKEVDALLGAEADQVATLRAAVEDTTNQFNVQTATWGLANWERLVGLTVGNDLSPLGLSTRRSAVLSKLQGQGTITESRVSEICKVYTSGTVEVVVDAPNYTVTLKFVDVIGIPPNYETLIAVLRELMPAHLALEIEFRYMTWNDLEALNRTWDAQDALNLNWDDFSTAQN